jgi:hypothetical protein
MVLGERSAATPLDSKFASLLSENGAELPADGAALDLAVLSDLNFDQVVENGAGNREERELISQLLSRSTGDLGAVSYRHEVLRDLEDPALLQAVTDFTEQVSQARAHLRQLSKMSSAHQQEGWFLDAAPIYCDAVRALADVLAERPVASRGLLAFRDLHALRCRGHRHRRRYSGQRDNAHRKDLGAEQRVDQRALASFRFSRDENSQPGRVSPVTQRHE